MTYLDKSNVATDPKAGWPFYALHVMSSNLIREFFRVSNYERCIKHAENYHRATKSNIDRFEKARGSFPHKMQVLAGAKELTDWVRKMETENYHELYVHSFIGMWSSFEAGLENVVADFLANDKSVALRALDGLKRPPVQMEAWPWDKERCLAVAQFLERVANRSCKAEWWDTLARVQQLFGYIEVQMVVDESVRADLSEANAVRNILLHRYGQVGEKEAKAFPKLSEWSGQVVPFDRQRFTRYYKAIVSVITSLLSSIGATHGAR